MFFIHAARRVVAFAIAVVMSLGVTSNKAPSHTVLNEKECNLCVAVMSDIHLEGNNLNTYNAFGRILKDVKKNSFGNDAAVFLGDNTMNGQDIESMLFYGILLKEKRIADQLIVAPGNHDYGNGEGDYEEFLTRFMNYNNGVLRAKISKPYYYKVVNGYYFIVLAPEDLCVHTMPITKEQLKFLDETLALATAEGKPAFVCAHHPCHYDEIIEGGDTLPRYDNVYLLDILNKYENVFYISGHTHVPTWAGWTFAERYGINIINLPKTTELLGEDSEVYEGTGEMIQLEVYDDRVVGRVRNAYTGEWLPELDYSFDLV